MMDVETRINEDARQFDLTERLGQVECDCTTHDWLGGGWVACPYCGACT